MSDDPSEFSTWLNTVMLSQGLSQAELARRVGVADTQVSRWRRGQVIPTLRYLQQLADTFGVPRTRLDRLVGYPIEGAMETTHAATMDAATEAAWAAHQAHLGQILQEKLLPSLWPAYVDACDALADALRTSLQTGLTQAQATSATEAISNGSAASEKEERTLGFHPRGLRSGTHIG
ncbi:MAG: helix-turn-helix transcriptional regulator [Herpetosiphonaceae bacterium]|nr:helix-turn-helix transcriptional regulator [Herpetosiphonaceae bacterium]